MSWKVREAMQSNNERGRSVAAGPVKAAPDLVAASRLLSYLNCNYARRVSIGEMAAYVGCTSFSLIRLSRRELGVTPHTLLLQIRIRRAATLIAAGGTIATAAIEVGFCDQSHFTRHFKRVLGATPGRFRAHATRDPAKPHDVTKTLPKFMTGSLA